MRDFPESGNIDELPKEIIDEFLDKINHIKSQGMWEKFKEIGAIYYSDSKIQLYYSDGDIIGVKKLDDDKILLYNIPFEKEEKYDN